MRCTPDLESVTRPSIDQEVFKLERLVQKRAQLHSVLSGLNQRGDESTEALIRDLSR
jgi:hypothetical protein